jgi:hypothetical protein
MSDASNTVNTELAELEKEVACCDNAARYCHERAAMAWGEKSRNMWRARASQNETWAAERRAKIASATRRASGEK